MKKLLQVVVPVLIVLLFVSVSVSYAAGDAAAGKDLFLKKCKACHGDDGAGTPAMLKKFGDKLKPLGSPAVQGMKDPALAKEIAEAANHKAIAKSLKPADTDNLVAFIRTLKK